LVNGAGLGGGAPLVLASIGFFHAGRRGTPSSPLNAFEAFEAAARDESFTRAADELCVTPSGQGSRGRARNQAVQPSAPAADHHRALPKIAIFRDWLVAEAAEDARRL